MVQMRCYAAMNHKKKYFVVKNYMRLVNQETNCDCVYACIAMVCGKTLNEVMKVARGKHALGQKEEFKLIAYFGYLPTLQLFEGLNKNGVYLVTVPSLNFEGGNHRIVITTAEMGEIKVYDPNKNRKDKKYYTKKTLRAWSQTTKITKY